MAILAHMPKIGDAFVEHPIPRIISFTGSTEVGGHIGQLAIKNFKKSILELGGNSAFIIMDDADIDYSVNAAIFSVSRIKVKYVCLQIAFFIKSRRSKRSRNNHWTCRQSPPSFQSTNNY